MNIRDFTFGEISDETCAILAEEASDIGDALPPQRAVDLAACRLLLQQSDGGHDPATVEPYLAEHGEQHAVRLGEEGLNRPADPGRGRRGDLPGGAGPCSRHDREAGGRWWGPGARSGVRH